MSNTVTPDDVLNPIYRTLNDDATLRGSQYLNSSNAVHNSSTRPPAAPLPAITMFARFGRFEGQQDFLDEYIINIIVYVSRNSDYSFDRTRMMRIKKREIELLRDKANLTGQSSGLTYKHMRLISGTEVSPFDPQAPAEATARTQYMMKIG